MTDTPKKVLMRAIEPHTYDGKDHAEGDTYEADADHVDFLTLRHWARPADDADAPKEKKLKAR